MVRLPPTTLVASRTVHLSGPGTVRPCPPRQPRGARRPTAGQVGGGTGRKFRNHSQRSRGSARGAAETAAADGDGAAGRLPEGPTL